MPNRYLDCWGGPIRGIRLPLNAWDMVQAEGITTIDELKAVAGRLETFVGIGRKTAQVIREELARIEASGE